MNHEFDFSDIFINDFLGVEFAKGTPKPRPTDTKPKGGDGGGKNGDTKRPPKK